jgi:hypothetical protein
MSKIGLEIRTDILRSALTLERLTSGFLASLLGIEDFTESKLLGNKSGSLSFNQKVELLIEIGSIPPEERSKFQTFMEIRNQFMHNFDAKNYESCFKYLEGKESWILKRYPQDGKHSKEEQLKLAVDRLTVEVIKLTLKIQESVQTKLKGEAEHEILKLSQEAVVLSIKDIKNITNSFFKEIVSKGQSLTANALQDFGNELEKAFVHHWNKNFDKLNAEANKVETVQE